MRKRQDGFSMIEMFVVLGIITCMILLLSPIISQVTNRALRAACQGNLRRLHQAFESFRQSNKGRYPRSRKGNDDAILQLSSYVPDLESIIRCPSSNVPGSYSYDSKHTDNEDDTIILGDSASYDEDFDGLGVSTNHDGLGGFYLRVNGTIEYVQGSIYRRKAKYRRIRLLDALFRQDPLLKKGDTFLSPINL